MAGPELTLSDEQQRGVMAWLEQHWTRPHDCPLHGPTTWEVSRVIAGAPVMAPDGGFHLDRAYPTVPVTCAVCGYSIFINAVKLGLLPSVPAGAAPLGGVQGG